MQTGIASLKIADALVHDSGKYEVVAENEAGQDKTSCDLIVKSAPVVDKSPIVDANAFRYVEPPQTMAPPTTRKPSESTVQEPPIAPNMISPLADQFVKEGEPANFTCKVFGKPKPTVSVD